LCYLIASSSKNSLDVNHAMAIIINTNKKTLEIFDPNGITPNTKHVYFWSKKLLEFLKNKNINLIRTITADELFCPQPISSYAKNFKNEGHCIA
jgi:hypothetical protein